MGELNFEQANNDLNDLLAKNGFTNLNQVIGFLSVAMLDIYTRNVIASNFELKREAETN